MDMNYDLHAKITVKELQRLQESCLECIRKDQLYQVRNDAKLRAVYTSQSYDEFKDIVDAAHLKPISRKDKNNSKTRNRLWNTSACEPDSDHPDE